jgi:hypothetical protein
MDQVQDFLLHLARPDDIKNALIGQFHKFGYLASNLFGRFGAPLLEPLVELFR